MGRRGGLGRGNTTVLKSLRRYKTGLEGFEGWMGNLGTEFLEQRFGLWATPAVIRAIFPPYLMPLSPGETGNHLGRTATVGLRVALRRGDAEAEVAAVAAAERRSPEGEDWLYKLF